LRISIPPLASRSADLPELANHLLGVLARKYRLPKPELGQEARHFALTHTWPGNVRELLHELERGLVLAEPGDKLALRAPSTPPPERKDDDWLNPDFTFPEDGFELENEILRLIQLGIGQCGGNVSAAARLLGVPRDYLRYRLKQPED
jgi:DNA-binding NtrC family response regulator